MPSRSPPERCYGGSSDEQAFATIMGLLIICLLVASLFFKAKMDQQDRHWDKVIEGIETQQAYAEENRCTASEETLMPMIVGKAIILMPMTNCTAWEPK